MKCVAKFFLDRTRILFQIHGMTVCFTKRAIAGKNAPPRRLVPKFGTSFFDVTGLHNFLLHSEWPVGIGALAMC